MERRTDRYLSRRVGVLALVMFLVTIWLMVGCTGVALVDFKSALMKTVSIEKGQATGEMKLSFVVDDDTLLDEEAIQKLQVLKDIRWQIEERYDDSKDAYKMEGTFSLGGIGLDFGYQKNGNDGFVRLPVVDKYIPLDELETFIDSFLPDYKGVRVSDEAQRRIQNLFMESLKAENVFKGARTILETPDGNVKARLFSITFSPQQTTDLVKGALAILEDEPGMRDILPEALLVKEMGHSIEFKAWVDADGYIIKDELVIMVELKNEGIKAFNVTFETVRSHIGEDQDFQWVEPSADELVDAAVLEENLPATLKSIIDATRGTH